MKKNKNIGKENDYQFHMNFYHPPLLPMPDIPVNLHHGAFMVKRRHAIHTGVDLYAPPGSPVYAIEDGEAVNIRWFTGKEAGTEFWASTKSIEIEGYTGTIGYGELIPVDGLKIGDYVKSGDIIGNLVAVLPKYKGKPQCMLHMSLHAHGWKYILKDQEDQESEPFFDLQIDPTLLLLQLKNKADRMELDDRFIQFTMNQAEDFRDFKLKITGEQP
jgi:hypothetical protein